MIKKDGEARLGDDILWGVAAIADELRVDRRTAEILVENGLIPSGRVGSKFISSRRLLREFFDAAVVGNRPAA
jgi:hypothetical protein